MPRDGHELSVGHGILFQRRDSPAKNERRCRMAKPEEKPNKPDHPVHPPHPEHPDKPDVPPGPPNPPNPPGNRPVG